MPPKRPSPPNGTTSDKSTKKSRLYAGRQIKTPSSLKQSLVQNAMGQANAKLLQSHRPLPDSLNVNDFVMARAYEISTLQSAMKTAAASATTRAFQSLPRHLRRRAASHNFKRVPPRLRAKAAAEIDPKDDTVKKQRKKVLKRSLGRKGMTRTQILQRRQRDKIWLESHIWHAKRMRMVDVWGHRIAKTPTLKSHRPAYRAAKNSCIINDVSYYATIELMGVREDLLDVLGKVTGGGSFAGGKYESGARIANTTLFHYSTWPFGMIGPAQILWKPILKPTSERSKRQLWIRIHPAMFEEAWKAIKESVESRIEGLRTGIVAGSSSAAAAIAGELGVISIKDLRGELNSFELMGPKSGKVLSGIMNVLKSESGLKQKAWDILPNLQSSSNLPPGIVIGLKVHDPRLSFPPHNASSSSTSMFSQPILPSSQLATSSIWDESERESLLKPTFKKADLDARRRELGIPGSKLAPQARDNRIPILLIQHTVGNTEPTFKDTTSNLHGFTLIFPSGWSMPFLQSLVFTGSLVGGIKERQTQHFETGSLGFPELWPSTNSGKEFWEDKAQEAIGRWERRPPAKRVNDLGLGVKRYWKPEWEGGDKDGDVVMDQQQRSEWIVPSPVIQQLQIQEEDTYSRTLIDLVNQHRQNLGLLELEKSEDLISRGLVAVEVIPTGRGSPKEMAVIYGIDEELKETWRRAEDAKLGEVESRAGLIAELGEILPRDEDLVGFVLSGNLSLARGRGHGIGLVKVEDYLKRSRRGEVFVRVRNRDETICRLARLRLVG